jgi:hypothetical protein
MRTNTILKNISALVPVQPRDESALKELDVFTTHPNRRDYWDVYDRTNEDDVEAHVALQYCVEKSIKVLLSMRPGEEIGARIQAMEMDYWERHVRHDNTRYQRQRYIPRYRQRFAIHGSAGDMKGGTGNDEEVESLDSGSDGDMKGGTDNDEDVESLHSGSDGDMKGGTNNDEKVAFPDLDFESLDSDSNFKSMIIVHPLFVFSDNNPGRENSRKFRVLSYVFDPKLDDDHSRVIFYDNTYSIRGRTLTRHVTKLYAEQDDQTDFCKGWGINQIFWDNIEHKVKMNYLDAFVVDMILQTQTIRALLTKMASDTSPSDHKCRWHFTTRGDLHPHGQEIDFVILSQRPKLRVHVMMPTQVEQNWLMNLLRPPKGGSLAQHIAKLGLNATFTKSVDMRKQRVKPRRYVRRFSAPGDDFEDNADTSGTHTRHNTRQRPSRYTHSADSENFDE